ncbi:MAG: GNAT family N-acetyltransferase [Proteobacteria bacterium]|nr:GNAT family N-acetyltransferase [Pseudomonadota bacterium]
MSVTVRMLCAGEEDALTRAASGVFDYPVRADLAREFLADPRHHIAVAMDSGIVVGFASAVHYIHPDKPAELWINEVGVAPSYRRQGFAKKILEVLLDRGRTLGCHVAWVLTDTDNAAARALYGSAGGEELSQNTVHLEFKLS